SFHDPATFELYTLSLHDALPILTSSKALQLRLSPDRYEKITPASLFDCFGRNFGRIYSSSGRWAFWPATTLVSAVAASGICGLRSEEHTSELQSRFDLVCRLLLE